jgi:hypothetical protein
MTKHKRRSIIAVIGDSNPPPEDARLRMASEVGRLLVDHGCRVITGGLGGVMAAAMAGARQSDKYREGDTIAVIPSHDPSEAAESADIVLATGLGLGRNIIVANADGVIAIGGGAGTLSEVALAWQLRRPIVALDADGWSRRIAAMPLDGRKRQPDVEDDKVHLARAPAEAVRLILSLVPRHAKRTRHV